MERSALHALTVAAAIAAAPPAVAQGGVPPPERYRLDNGMEVILSQQPGTVMVAVDLSFHVGAASDPMGREGLADLAGLLFAASEHESDAFTEVMTRYGGLAVGHVTGHGWTSVRLLLPGYNLDAALWLASGRMRFLEAENRRRLELAKQVVRTSTRPAPMESLADELRSRMFPTRHRLGLPIAGTSDSRDHVRVSDVRAFYARWYRPANATLALVGDFDPKEARRLVTLYFGDLASAPEPEVPPLPRPQVQAGTHHVAAPAGESSAPGLALGWLVPGRFEAGEPEVVVLRHVLLRRLQSHLVWGRRLARAVDVRFVRQGQAGVLQILIEGRTRTRPEALRQAVEAVLDTLSAEGPQEREIRQALRRFATRTVREMDGVSGLLASAHRLQLYNHVLGSPDRLAWDMKRYQAVTPESVRAVVEAWLPKHRAVIVVRDTDAASETVGGAP